MQRATFFAAKLLLGWLVLLVIYPFDRVYAQEKIRIGISSSSPGFLPTVVAEQRGYFAKYGLASEHIRISLAVAINALSTGDLDYAITIAQGVSGAIRGVLVKLLMMTPNSVAKLRRRKDVSDELKEHILWKNGARLYGLS